MKPRINISPSPIGKFPTDKAGVLDIANQWNMPELVKINDDAIQSLALPDFKIGAEQSMAAGSLGRRWEDDIALSLALNSINYQFWDLGKGGEFLRYDFEGIVGAMGMRTAFERAWADPASPLSLARQGVHIQVEDITAMFGAIPSPQSRADILNEVLLPRGENGSSALDQAVAVIAQDVDAGNSFNPAQANLLATLCPQAFGDPVLKKAQLAISEVWVKGREHGKSLDCDLTAFADYQIPNILRTMGVLSYDDELAAHIDAQKLIEYGSVEECAIRGASLLAVEKIAAHAGVPVAAVDHYLWARRKEATTPFHLTVTTAY